MRRLNPNSIHPPFANYAHGRRSRPGRRASCSAPANWGLGPTASFPTTWRLRRAFAFAPSPRSLAKLDVARRPRSPQRLCRLGPIFGRLHEGAGRIREQSAAGLDLDDRSGFCSARIQDRDRGHRRPRALERLGENRMLPTKFWAEMSWRDFAAADMSKVVAVLPVAAIEQHGPHLPVGVDTFINEGYLATRVQQIPDDMPVLDPARPGDRQIQRAYRISRHADVFARDGHARLDRNRRQRRAGPDAASSSS